MNNCLKNKDAKTNLRFMHTPATLYKVKKDFYAASYI
jgi:hypothetical protein